MTEKQMIYLYLYGTVRQLETVIILTDLAKGVKTRNSKERDVLMDLISWIASMDSSEEYRQFFTEFCKGVDRYKSDGEVSTIEAVKEQVMNYGKID